MCNFITVNSVSIKRSSPEAPEWISVINLQFNISARASCGKVELALINTKKSVKNCTTQYLTERSKQANGWISAHLMNLIIGLISSPLS